VGDLSRNKGKTGVLKEMIDLVRDVRAKVRDDANEGLLTVARRSRANGLCRGGSQGA
jgi:hypothetical protein